MCLYITQKQYRPYSRGVAGGFDPVVRKTPHIAYKAVMSVDGKFITPYQNATVRLGVVYKASIRPVWDVVRAGLHMCLNMTSTRRHANDVLVALVPPGAEVYYSKYHDEIAVSEAVYFRTRDAAELWWKNNWQKYKDKM